MKRLCATLALAVVLAASPLVVGCAREAGSAESAITVSAGATVDIVPDQANIALLASAEGATAEQAHAAGAEAANAVVERLRALGVDQADIQTSDVGIIERYGERSVQQITDGYFDWDGNWVEYVVDEVPSDGAGDVVGYDMTVRIAVSRLKVADVGTVVRSAIDAGASGVEGVSYVVSDRDAAYRQALGAAVEAAHAKAESLAQASGVYVGRVVNLVENTSATFDAIVEGDASALEAAGESLVVEPGRVPVEAGVTVSYAIS